MITIICCLIYFIASISYFLCKINGIKEKYYSYYNKDRYEKIVYLNYNDFKNYYQINKSKWKLRDGLIYYITDNKEELLICFKREDLFKTNRYISNLISKNGNAFSEINKRNLEKLLNSVQKDINDTREEYRKEIEKASNTFMDVYKDLLKNDKERTKDLDAIINASKTDC